MIVSEAYEQYLARDQEERDRQANAMQETWDLDQSRIAEMIADWGFEKVLNAVMRMKPRPTPKAGLVCGECMHFERLRSGHGFCPCKAHTNEEGEFEAGGAVQPDDRACRLFRLECPF